LEQWSAGEMEDVKKLENQERYNLNRGYQNLRVCKDSILLYTMILKVFKNFPFEFKKVASQQMASVDSVYRDIAVVLFVNISNFFMLPLLHLAKPSQDFLHLNPETLFLKSSLGRSIPFVTKLRMN
jgi:hypothetical protein